MNRPRCGGNCNNPEHVAKRRLEERMVYCRELLKATQRKIETFLEGPAYLDPNFEVEVEAKVRKNGRSANEDTVLIMRTLVVFSEEPYYDGIPGTITNTNTPTEGA